ncbi:MAG: hypothetical protein GEV10_17115 [Streptosporangiales bacterium]|nr:hypothetical protein [Streptosporangiales bacterium]
MDPNGADRPDDPDVAFLLLGSLEVRVGDRPVELKGHRERAIVALLLQRTGEIVGASQIADVVWGPATPPTAAVQIQNCVSRIRKGLAAAGVTDARAVVATRPPGYVLTGRVTTDLADFRALSRDAETAARRGDHAGARDLFVRALGLWRDVPFAGIDASELDAAAERLIEEWLLADEGRLDAELALGGHADLVPDLLALVGEHPLREHLRGQLMLALYRAGRRADALRVYQDGRELLVEELGLDPGDELRDLHRRMLRDDSSLLVATGTEPPSARPELPVPRQLPADVPHLVGRDRHADAVRARLTGRTGDAPAVVCLHGGGGVGKSALAVHVGHGVARSFPDGQLYAHLGGTGGRPADPADVLAAFLRALGLGGDAVPAGLDERAALFRSRLADRAVLVVLDDAADTRQVRPLLPPSRDSAVLITGRRPLRDLAGAVHESVGPLGSSDGVELLHASTGTDGALIAASRIVELCGGLPLAIRVVAARLTGASPRAVDRFVGRLLDERQRLDLLQVGDLAVRASLLLSWEHLTADERRLLRRLALIPHADFPRWVAAPLLDSDEDAGHDLLATLVAVHLIEPDSADAAGRATYRLHDLVRLVARERLDEEEDDTTRDAALGRLHHAWLGLAEATDQAIAAGSTVNRGLALSGGAPPQATESARGDPLAWFERWHDQLTSTVEQAATRDGDVAARLATRLDGLFSIRNVADLRIRAVEAAERSDDVTPGLRARLLLQLATAHGQAGAPPDEMLPFAERAVPFARDSGDTYLEVKAREQVAWYRYVMTEFDTAVDELQLLLPVARETDTVLHRQTLTLLGNALAQSGQPQHAIELFAEALDGRDGGEDTRGTGVMLLHYALRLLDVDRGAEAERQLRRALAIVEPLTDDTGIAYLSIHLAEALAQQGRWREADDAFARAAEIFGRDNSPGDEMTTEHQRGRLESLRGRHVAAIRTLTRVLSLCERERQPLTARRVRFSLSRAYQRAGERERPEATSRDHEARPAGHA